MKDVIEVKEGGIAEHELAHQQFDFTLWLQERLIKTAPMWLASIALHILLLVLLSTFSVTPQKTTEVIKTIVDFSDIKKPLLDDEKIPLIPPVPIEKQQPVEKVEPIYDSEIVDNESGDNEIDPPSPIRGKGDTDSAGISGRRGFRPKGGGRRIWTIGNPPTSPIPGLIWLAKHQNPDGSWGAKSFLNQCKERICGGAGDMDYDIGLTGLALLAFLGAGYTPSSRDTYEGCDFGEVIRNASMYLITIQDAQGVFGGVRPGKFMYNQAIATYAITDLYSQLKNTVSEVQFKEPAQRAIDYLVNVRTPGKAWRYQPNDDRDNDTSVTGWVAMALKSAEAAELNVPPRVFADIKTFYDSVTDPSYGRVGYTGLGTVALKGGEENLNPVFQPSPTAIGIMTRIFIDHKASDATLKNGVQLVLSSLPTWDINRLGIIDYYYWFYGSYCLNQYDGPNGPAWKTWNERMKSVLLNSQKVKDDGCASGSWDPIDRWGDEGGRVYATAINVLTLEVYYRLRIIMREKDVAVIK